MKKIEEILNSERIWGHTIVFPVHSAWIKLPDCGTCSVIWSENEDGIPFYVPHDNTPNYAYMITLPNGEKLLYATDFGYLPYTFKKTKINHFLIECNHLDMAPDKTSGKYKHSIKGHSSLSTVKKIMQINKSPNLSNAILCHLSESWGNPEIMQHEIETVVGDEVSVKIAHSGLICELSEIPF